MQKQRNKKEFRGINARLIVLDYETTMNGSKSFFLNADLHL